MLKRIHIEGKGFNVLKDFNSWRIATIGYDEEVNSLKGINTMGRHFETDEVFVLLEGTAYLVIAGFNDKPDHIEVEKLEKGNLYIVSEKQWHVAVLDPMSTLLIIENENTGFGNSENYNISNLFLDKIKSKF